MRQFCPSEKRGHRECRVQAAPMARLQQKKQVPRRKGPLKRVFCSVAPQHPSARAVGYRTCFCLHQEGFCFFACPPRQSDLAPKGCYRPGPGGFGLGYFFQTNLRAKQGVRGKFWLSACEGLDALNTPERSCAGKLSTASGRRQYRKPFIGEYRMGYRLCAERGTVYA